MSASARWDSEPGAERWNCYPLLPEGSDRLLVIGHGRVVDEGYTFTVQVALISKIADKEELAAISEAEQNEITRSVHSLVWDRFIQVAMSLSGIAASRHSLHRREEPPFPASIAP
ncbi:hypothetical protein [Isoptericola sp. AK164]|uniref:hypothetical protein n=1 Tax=Isoptericola sp. AK164 TaxID=3024246 RepID=UPI0024188F65|nr:hypothetical protein [Isoptericola sp. AK164]